MRRVFVSGCFDVLHQGHVSFLRDAKALGDDLTVCIATDEVYQLAKGRKPIMPFASRIAVMRACRYVDAVFYSTSLDPVLDFSGIFEATRPHVLAVTDDDRHIESKQKLCAEVGCQLVVLPKSHHDGTSSSSIARAAKGKSKVPLRVDFAGGWLDVPRFARPGGYIVNCAIEPMVSLDDWSYEIGGGLGGSAAKAILDLRDGVTSELAAGVGWQDAAVIEETGLCVWRSGAKPILQKKYNPDFLRGRMLLYWTGKPHVCAELADQPRDYSSIIRISQKAAELDLPESMELSYVLQLAEGMEPIPRLGDEEAKKYCGGGWGGYALYLYASEKERDAAHAANPKTICIEPYLRS